MGQKKGIVPSHIQPKIFNHPKADSSWIAVFSKITDLRKPSCNTRHSVVTILFIVFVAVLCGAKKLGRDLSYGRGFSKLAKHICRSF